jgi:hypothetical protein
MEMSNKQEYLGQLSDLAHTHDLKWREELLKKRLITLAGFQVLIDLDENRGDENFDPFFFRKPRDLLHAIGEYMRSDDPLVREQWSILILTYLEENITSYYGTQIRSDLEDRIEELQKCSNDIDSQADRALEDSK